MVRGSKNYEGIKKACLEYAENIKIMCGTAAPIFQQTRKFDKDPKEAKIGELCKQIQKSSFDDDEATMATSEAGVTGVLQVRQEGPLRVTV